MQIVKKYMVVIVLLILVVIVWLGILFVSSRQFVPVNPNATSYTKPLKPSFNQESLDKVTERTESSFPVLPLEFFELDN